MMILRRLLHWWRERREAARPQSLMLYAEQAEVEWLEGLLDEIKKASYR